MAQLNRIHVPSNLAELVKTTFERAKASGDLNYYPTQVAVLKHKSVVFQLRFSPSLASKPEPPPSPKSETTKPYNPFLSPHPALIICPLPPDHTLLLNKFAIVPGHFLLVTNAVKQQTDLLEREDLAAVWECMKAYKASAVSNSSATSSTLDEDERGDDGEVFAFFNSGKYSGASEAHRHIQLLPVASMRAGLEECEGGGEWTVLADRLIEDSAETQTLLRDELPFRTFVAPLGDEQTMNGKRLHEIYLGLYREACVATLGPHHDTTKGTSWRYDGPAEISYNLAITRKAMVLCPRISEGANIYGASSTGEKKEAGKLELNGTFLAGTALVKTEAEWNALKDDTSQLWSVLSAIGAKS